MDAEATRPFGGARLREMDNPYTNWDPIPLRPPLRWPKGARLAIAIVVNVEYAEWLPPLGTAVPRSLVHRGPYPEIPDIHEISPHEYGNRVGVFRVMDLLDRHGMPATIAMDGMAATRYPFLIDQFTTRNWEVIGHGLSSSRLITQTMTEADEREHLELSLEMVRRATGVQPRGWSGIEYGESNRTVRLLAEQGIRYVFGWPNDEQPYRFNVPIGEIYNLPVSIDLDEVVTHLGRGVPIQRWGQMVVEAFDSLYYEATDSGRLISLSLHPWVIGQPFRIKHLANVLEHLARASAVWFATGEQIVDWYRGQVAEADIAAAPQS